MRKLFAGDWTASVWTGVVFGLLIGRVDEPQPVLGSMLLGGLYALAVHGLMGLFGVRRWGWVVAGALAGPFPFALLWAGPALSKEDRGGAIFVGVILGLALGLVRWAREARRADGAARAE